MKRQQERLFVMDNLQRGKLILKAVPAGETEKKVVMLLLKFAKTASADELTDKVRNMPYELSNDIEAEKAAIFMAAFQKLGATAAFLPHKSETPIPETPAPVQRDPNFSFDSFSDEDTPPPAIHVKPPKKNGTRRLTMILVFILLLLSIGYLAWQLWPDFGNKVQELINTLKQLL